MASGNADWGAFWGWVDCKDESDAFGSVESGGAGAVIGVSAAADAVSGALGETAVKVSSDAFEPVSPFDGIWFTVVPLEGSSRDCAPPA